MHEGKEAEIVKTAYQFQCALVGNGNLTEESFKKAQARSKEVFNDLVNLHQPWAAKTTEEVQMEEYSKLIQTYKDTIGDPDDPAFMEALKAGLAARNLADEVVEEETEEQRVSRLMSEYSSERQRRFDALKQRR